MESSLTYATLLFVLSAACVIGAEHWRIDEWLRIVLALVAIWCASVAFVVLVLYISERVSHIADRAHYRRTRTVEVLLAERIHGLSGRAQEELIKNSLLEAWIELRPGLGRFYHFGTHVIPEAFVEDFIEASFKKQETKPRELASIRDMNPEEWASAITAYIVKNELADWSRGNKAAIIRYPYSMSDIVQSLE